MLTSYVAFTTELKARYGLAVRPGGPVVREHFFAPGRPALTSGPPVRLVCTDTRRRRRTSGPSGKKALTCNACLPDGPDVRVVRTSHPDERPCRSLGDQSEFLYHSVLHCIVLGQGWQCNGCLLKARMSVCPSSVCYTVQLSLKDKTYKYRVFPLQPIFLHQALIWSDSS